MPVMTLRVTLSEEAGVTQMMMTSTFPSLEAMEQMADMGVEEGIRAALSQIDGILAA